MSAPIPRAKLLDAAFHQGPIFRQGFDAHIRTWRTAVQEQVWTEYWSDTGFRAAYDARRNAVRDLSRREGDRFLAANPLRRAADLTMQEKAA